MVFYDGSCPLCSREIRHYQRRRHAGRLRWVDVSTPEYDSTEFGLDQTRAMARFHVMDRHGDWQTGAAGFVALWSELPAYRWLATFIRQLRLVSLLDWCYQHFSNWRLRRQCSTSECDKKP